MILCWHEVRIYFVWSQNADSYWSEVKGRMISAFLPHCFVVFREFLGGSFCFPFFVFFFLHTLNQALWLGSPLLSVYVSDSYGCQYLPSHPTQALPSPAQVTISPLSFGFTTKMTPATHPKRLSFKSKDAQLLIATYQSITFFWTNVVCFLTDWREMITCEHLFTNKLWSWYLSKNLMKENRQVRQNENISLIPVTYRYRSGELILC